MQIFIKFEGRSIVIEIDGRNKIEKVKGIIEDKEGIPVELQFLSYGNKPLLDNYRLEDYDIKSRFTLYLGIKGGSKNETNCILINIRIPEDKKFKCPSSIKLYTQTTVIQLKEEIELKLREELVENEMNMNIEFNEMVLSQYGKVLNDAEVVRLGSCLEVIFILVFGVYNVSGTKITDIKMENREVKCFELKNKINEILGIMPKELFTKTNIGNFQIEEDSSIIPLQSKLCISSKINILITSLIRNTFSLEVDLFCNVLSVKELIKDRENIPIDNQCLTYEENTLLSQDPLFLNSNIEEESVLFLCISPPILLNIKSSVGQNIPFEIEMNETVEMLKERYCCGILPIHEQIILFQGTKLDDQSSLNQYIFLETSLEVVNYIYIYIYLYIYIY